jgi:hypothetical protein
MPKISRFYGIIITMYFPDHNPPHFHVRYNEYRAVIDISTGKMIGSMTERALKFIHEWWMLHKDELWENWINLQKGEPLNKIKSLE